MDALIPEFGGSISSHDGAVHILLVGNCRTGRLKKILETEGEFREISEVRNNDEILDSVGNNQPDVIIALTDSETTIEGFDKILLNLSKIHMNTRTIIISDNPFKYLRCALKAKVAALLYRKIDKHDLIPIIREVHNWSHGQPLSGRYSQKTTSSILRLNQEVEEM
jgi:DNA-binding NarL/FixJ family response regulator